MKSKSARISASLLSSASMIALVVALFVAVVAMPRMAAAQYDDFSYGNAPDYSASDLGFGSYDNFSYGNTPDYSSYDNYGYGNATDYSGYDNYSYGNTPDYSSYDSYSYGNSPDYSTCSTSDCNLTVGGYDNYSYGNAPDYSVQEMPAGACGSSDCNLTANDCGTCATSQACGSSNCDLYVSDNQPCGSSDCNLYASSNVCGSSDCELYASGTCGTSDCNLYTSSDCGGCYVGSSYSSKTPYYSSGCSCYASTPNYAPSRAYGTTYATPSYVSSILPSLPVPAQRAVTYAFQSVPTPYPAPIPTPIHTPTYAATGGPATNVNTNTNTPTAVASNAPITNTNTAVTSPINNTFAPVLNVGSVGPQPLAQAVVPPAPVPVPTYTPTYTTSYQPQTPYVSLSQIPYTGFDYGPFGNAMYWLALFAFAGAAAYLMIYYIPGAKLAFAGIAGKRVANSYNTPEVREVFKSNLAASASPTVLDDETMSASVLPTVSQKSVTIDHMIVDTSNGTPRIVIARE